jgi:hypothetical protein
MSTSFKISSELPATFSSENKIRVLSRMWFCNGDINPANFLQHISCFSLFL